MEKKTSSSFMKNQLSTIKEINSTNLSEEDFLSLFSWPPRSYTCTFCKREFRSAQALGGHMNVHRRDRARLRQLAPLHHAHLNLNLDPNPSFICFNSCNPSFSSAAAAKVVPQSLMIPPSVSTISTTPPATVSDHLMKWGRADFSQDLMVKTKELAARRFFELEKLANSGDEIVKMELNFGMISEVKEDDHHVDLELRLGYV